MDVMAILSLASTAMQIASDPKVKNLIHGGIKSITPDAIHSLIPSAESVLAAFGAMLSPKADATAHAAIALIATATSGTSLGERTQIQLNNYLKGTPGFSPLVVDGKLGEKTHDAIMAAQKKAGIKVDGWLGTETARAIGLSLA